MLINPKFAAQAQHEHEAVASKGYFYRAYELSHDDWLKHDIGMEYQGGVVVEGTGDGDSDINNSILVVRYGHPTGNIEKRGKKWQERKDCGL